MSKVITLVLIILACFVSIQAQDKRNHVWCFGYSSDGDSTSMFGGQNLCFSDEDSFEIKYRDREADFDATSTSICDQDGHLLFYTNGCKVWRADDTVMPGGEQLTRLDNYWTADFFCLRGFTAPQGALILPVPNFTDRYYLFHQDVKNGEDNFPVFEELYMTTVSFENDPAGEVIELRTLVLNEPMFFGSLTACKHANGIDWWIVVCQPNFNGFYKLLVTKNGVEKINEQFIGEAQDEDIIGGVSCKLDKEGNFYARNTITIGLDFMKFNRWTGEFSDHQFVPEWFERTFDIVGNGLEFSPDSKRLYTCNSLQLYQFDLEHNNIGDHFQLIDTFVYDSTEFSQSTFYLLERGPDDRIYMSHLGSSTYLSTINKPNMLGNTCDFRHRDIPLLTNNAFTLPHFPNYNLGKLATSTEEINGGSTSYVYPNPTHHGDDWYIDSEDLIDSYLLVDVSGKIVKRQDVRTRVFQLSSDGLAVGYYHLVLRHLDNSEELIKLILIE
jgi:hypothetical protein